MRAFDLGPAPLASASTCLAVLERVRKTGQPLQVTRFGKPVAQIIPPPPPTVADDWLGKMRSTGRIVGDINVASDTLVDWDV